jgi:hypothetical protein
VTDKTAATSLAERDPERAVNHETDDHTIQQTPTVTIDANNSEQEPIREQNVTEESQLTPQWNNPDSCKEATPKVHIEMGGRNN